MLITIYKSKIHNARVTESNLSYTGSITIDSDLLKAADMLVGEKVQVVNLNNGSRVETYIMVGEAGSGAICMNGPAARWAEPGDKIIIISYCLVDPKEASSVIPKAIFLDDENKIKKGKDS